MGKQERIPNHIKKKFLLFFLEHSIPKRLEEEKRQKQKLGEQKKDQ